MIPYVDAGSSQLAMPPSCRNGALCDGEEDEEDDGADDGAELGLDEQGANETDPGDPFVGRCRRWLCSCDHLQGDGCGGEGLVRPLPPPDRQRVPAAASFEICVGVVLRDEPGPVRTGWPPPMVLRFDL